MTKYIGDTGLSLSPTALAVNAMLSRTELENTDLHVTVGAWYNGREAGISLQVFDYRKPALVIVVCEDRHSDRPIVYTWRSKYPGSYLNPPNTSEKEFEQAYGECEYFEDNDIRGVYEHVMSLIRSY